MLLFQRLGARVVVLTNAAGGLDPTFGPGTLMVMRDHINLTGQNPLMGPNADELGPRFPDLTDAWSPRLRERLHAAAKAEGVDLEEGIYVGLTGPSYETPAEVRMYAGLGGHAIGMSTVLECIAARWVGLEVCGVSLVTNAGAGYTGEPLSHEEVLAAGAEAGPRLARRFIAELPRARPDADLSAIAAAPLRERPVAAIRCPPTTPRARGPRSVGVRAWRQARRPGSALAAAWPAFSAQAPRTLSLCGRMGQCSSRFLNSSQ